jgi:hypothetical protein
MHMRAFAPCRRVARIENTGLRRMLLLGNYLT